MKKSPLTLLLFLPFACSPKLLTPDGDLTQANMAAIINIDELLKADIPEKEKSILYTCWGDKVCDLLDNEMERNTQKFQKVSDSKKKYGFSIAAIGFLGGGATTIISKESTARYVGLGVNFVSGFLGLFQALKGEDAKTYLEYFEKVKKIQEQWTPLRAKASPITQKEFVDWKNLVDELPRTISNINMSTVPIRCREY